MQVSRLTYNTAFEICSGRFQFQEFYDKAQPDQYIVFTHQNVIYSWNVISGHRIIPACIRCGETDSYNFAGYGTMYLKHNGVDQLKLPNGKHRRMEVYCKKHIQQFSEYSKSKPAGTQLTLF
jgi:hypothetical protein